MKSDFIELRQRQHSGLECVEMLIIRPKLRSLLVFFMVLAAEPAWAQNSIFLCIPGVDGGVLEEGFVGCSDVLATDDSVTQSAQGVQGGGATIARTQTEVSSIRALKPLNVASVDFRSAVFIGARFPTGDILYVTEVNDQLRVFFEVKMENFIIESYNLNVSTGQGVTEVIAMLPQKAVWNFYTIREDGMRVLDDSFCWDFFARASC